MDGEGHTPSLAPLLTLLAHVSFFSPLSFFSFSYSVRSPPHLAGRDDAALLSNVILSIILKHQLSTVTQRDIFIIYFLLFTVLEATPISYFFLFGAYSN
jgi:hypothetical protein